MRKNKNIRFLSLVLLITVLSSVLITAALAYNADYTVAASESKITLNAVDIVEQVTGEKLSEIEKEYLTLCGDFSFSYTSKIADGVAGAVYYEKTESLVVNAKEHEYTCSDGTKVIWKPKSASFGGNTKDLFIGADNE